MSQEASPPVGPLLPAGLDSVTAMAAELAALPAWPLGDNEVVAALDRIAQAESYLTAVKLSLIAEVEGRRLGQAAGAASTAAWLRQRHRSHPGSAAAAVRTAVAVHSSCAATGAAVAAARVSAEQAAVIVSVLDRLPSEVEAGARVRAEEFLIGQAAALDPLLLARASLRR